MSNDSRQFYVRLSKAGFQGLPVSQTFLDKRPLVKTPATEEADAVYYTAADGLTFEAAMRLYAPHTVALMQEGSGAPINLGTLDANETLPEGMTHAFFGLHNWSPFEIAELVNQAEAIGIPINNVLIPWGVAKDNYLTTGELPA